MTFLDLHHFYKAPDNLAAGVHVGVVQPFADLFGELIHMAEHKAKFSLSGGIIRGCGGLLFEAIQSLAGMLNTRLEFVFVQQAIFVRIDQSADAAPRSSDLLIDLRGIDILFFVPAQAAFEFALESAGILKHLADIRPDRRVQPIQAKRLVRADAFTAVSISIHPGTTIVGIRGLVVLGESRQSLTIIGVSTTAAFQQALQQVSRPVLLPPGAFAVLGQLLGGGLKKLLADDSGYRDSNLIFRLAGVARHRVARLCRAAASRTQLWATWTHARLAEYSLTDVRGVSEQLRDRRRAPALALGAGDALSGQPAGDPPQRQAVPGNPFEYLLDHLGLLEVHLVVRLTTPFVLTDITISVRRAAQNADRTPTRRVAFATSTAFHDLCPLVFGDHALHLEQQVFLRARPNHAIQEYQFHPAALEFLHQQHLPGVFAGQTIRRVNVQPLEPACPGGVAQPLQRRANQRAAGVAVVNEAEFLIDRQAIGPHTLPQVGNLTVDRPLLGLLVRRDPSIDRGANRSRFRHSVVLHGSRSLGNTPGSIPAVRPGILIWRHPCRHRHADHRNHQFVGTSQHLRFQPAPDKLPPQFQQRPFDSASTIHGLPFQKGDSPQHSLHTRVNPAATPTHTGAATGFAAPPYLSSLRSFRQHCPYRVQRFARRDVGLGGLLGVYDGARQGQLVIPLKPHPAQVKPQGVQVQQHVSRLVVGGIDTRLDLRVGVDPGQELLRQCLAPGFQFGPGLGLGAGQKRPAHRWRESVPLTGTDLEHAALVIVGRGASAPVDACTDHQQCHGDRADCRPGPACSVVHTASASQPPRACLPPRSGVSIGPDHHREEHPFVHQISPHPLLPLAPTPAGTMGILPEIARKAENHVGELLAKPRQRPVHSRSSAHPG